MSKSTEYALEPGSLVVVSGANGNIASHVVDKLLQLGFRVRGTVRSKDRGGWIADHFGAKYGADKIEVVEVPDMGAPSAFDEAVRGAAGFVHVATPVMENANPNEAVPTVVRGMTNVLQAAAAEPSIKRVVITSSSGAATNPKPNTMFHIDSNMWNEEAVEAAWKPPPYEGLERKLNVYYACKTQGEQAAWKFVDERKPGFVLNAILPNANFGRVVDAGHQAYHSTLGWTKAVWDGFQGDDAALKDQPPQYYINIEDNAWVHAAALLYPDVKGERLFTFAHPYNWNDILAVLRKAYPERKFIDDIPDLGQDLSTVTNERAEELLKRVAGHGWTSLEDSVKQAVEGFAEK